VCNNGGWGYRWKFGEVLASGEERVVADNALPWGTGGIVANITIPPPPPTPPTMPFEEDMTTPTTTQPSMITI